MRISIVTLSFNQREFLEEAIESVLRQDYPDLEYIVVDPGSTDGSRELIQSYASGIAHAIFEPDRGAADGLNKGFARATGEIFGFLNADDLLEPGALQRVAEFFRTHPEIALAMGNGYIIDAMGNRLRYVRARDFTVMRYLYGGTRWLQQSTFFRRETFLESTGFEIRNHTCWDGELFVSMVCQGAAVGYINTDLGNFRIHSKSISGSGTNGKAYREDWMRVFRQVRGRDWRAMDNVRRLLYRGEGILLGAGMLLARRIQQG
jgi:glycosyltransferase involved in cell wall biosynthesis